MISIKNQEVGGNGKWTGLLYTYFMHLWVWMLEDLWAHIIVYKGNKHVSLDHHNQHATVLPWIAPLERRMKLSLLGVMEHSQTQGASCPFYHFISCFSIWRKRLEILLGVFLGHCERTKQDLNKQRVKKVRRHTYEIS